MSEDLPTTPSGREGPDHGKTVVNGELRRTSVSALQMADADTGEGCLRKWWHGYVQGFKEPTTDAQARGTRLHGETERYLLTGEKRLSDQILRNLHLIPTPGSDLLIEHPTIPEMPDGSSGLHLAPLRAAGIPIVGFIDLIDDRCVNQGTSEIEDTRDPEGTIQVTDWKFPNSMDYAKQAHELVKTIQMAGYGKYVFNTVPDVKLVRLSHGYMPVRGRGAKPSARVDQDAIERSWEHAESVARSIRDAARETDPEKITPNRRACRAFKKLCIHAEAGRCTAGTHNSLRAIANAKITHPGLITKEDIMTVSLIQKLRGQAATPATVAATIGLTGTTVAPTPDPASAAAEAQAAKDAEIAKLKAEETEQRAIRAFDTVAQKIAAHGRGFPALSGEAARLAMAGSLKNTGGNGELQELVIDNVTQLTGLLEELVQLAAKKAAELANTPAPMPAAAPAAPVVQVAPPAGNLLPPDAPEVVVPVASTGPAPTAPPGKTVEAPADVTAAKKPGKAPKEKIVKTPAPTDGQYTLLIDAVAEDGATSLHEFVAAICAELAEKYNAADIRVASNDTPLGFGKWPGALAGRVRELAAELPPGIYSADTRCALRAIAVEAIADVIRTKGRVIRGVR